MGFDHRKLLPQTQSNLSDDVLCKFSCNPILNKGGFCIQSCFTLCSDVCKNVIVFGGDQLPPPLLPNPLPPPPPPPPPSLTDRSDGDYHQPQSEQKHIMETGMTISACIIGVALLIALVLSIVRFCYRRNNSRRRSSSLPILFGTQQDFLDEDHGPALDLPIWYIHTVGLPQSVIDSITVCKYRKDDGLIEGTDCSVCLSEFEEDESLRLLPKCSHAFHIPCIDTWLRSHKNCPLCRAPVVNIANAQVGAPEPGSSGSGSGSRESIQVENLESNGGVGSLGSGTSEVGVRDEDNVLGIPIEEEGAENSRKIFPHSIVPLGSCDPRALSDLADNRHATENNKQLMRRSVSMDSSSALRIYHDVASVIPEQGSSNSQLVHVKNPNSGIVSKHGSSSSSLAKLMISSSIGFSLPMGPISMKRPFSSSRKLFSSKHARSQSSILPL